MEAPKKRGRGRPRKGVAPEPIPEAEPVIEPSVSNDHVESYVLDSGDLSDIARAPKNEPPPPLETGQEEEVINLAPEPTFALPSVSHVAAVQHLPPPPPEKAADTMNRSVLVGKIKKYRQSFEAVRGMRFDEEKMTDEQLQSLLTDIRLMVSSKNASMVFKTAYVTGVKGFELVAGRVGGKVYGLSDMLAKSPAVDSILLEIEAEMGIGYVPPMQRLMFVTLSSAVALDGMNRRAELLNNFKNEAVKPDLAAAYKDL